MKIIEKIYNTFVRICDQLQSPFLLLVRVYWGWQLMQTGWGKVGDLGKVTNFFMSLGIPLPGVNAVFVSGLELVGGLLLMVGLATRPIALLLVVDMLVAYITADREAFFSFLSSPDKFAAAAPFVFLLVSYRSDFRAREVFC